MVGVHDFSTSSTQPFTRDAAGNLTGDGTHEYVYNAWNQLVAVNDGVGDPIVEYGYDVLGRRIFRVDFTNPPTTGVVIPTEYYYYDGNRVIEIHQKAFAGTPIPGDYTLDTCSSGGGNPPPGEETSKRIEPIDTRTRVTKTAYKSGFDEPSRDRKGADKSHGVNSAAPQTKDALAAKSTDDDPPIFRKDDVYLAPEAQAAADKPRPVYVLPLLDEPGEVVPVRRFVYGLDYIDEPVAQITPSTVENPNSVRYMLRDANYNVVGIVRDCDTTLIRQFRYDPYGTITAAEDGAGVALPSGFPLESWHMFQGLMYDPATATPTRTGLHHARGRDYRADLGRFLSRDPNEQGLVLSSNLAMNGQTPLALASISASAQYIDGMRLYGFAQGNPITGRDPSGMMSVWDDDIEDAAAAYYADRVATQVDVIEQSKALMRSAGSVLNDMLERLALEQASAAVWAPAPYAFALYDTLNAFAAILDHDATWGTVGSALITAKMSASVGAGLGIKLRRGQKASAGLGIDISRSRFNSHLGDLRRTRAGTNILRNARRRAVRRAWKQERALLKRRGKGTRKWTPAQKAELLATGRVKGYQGHHINSVNRHPEHAGNPNNIEFVTPAENLLRHRGNFRNQTSEPFIDRSGP